MNNSYYKENITKSWLIKNGFRFNKTFSDENTEVYTYRFPVYRYEKMIILESEISVILGENGININVYEYNTNDKYAPFYYCEYGNYDTMLKIIWDKINKELRRLKVDIT